VLETAAVAFAMFFRRAGTGSRCGTKKQRYALCAFPWGGCERPCWWGRRFGGAAFIPAFAARAGLCLAPVLVTGGITWTATPTPAMRWQAAPRRKKAGDIKGPHCCAFADILLCTYFTAYLGLCSAVDCTPRAVLCMGLGFVLSGRFPLCDRGVPFGKKHGPAHTFATGADRTDVRRACLYWCALAAAGMAAAGGMTGAAMALAAELVFCDTARCAKAFRGISATWPDGFCKRRSCGCWPRWQRAACFRG
jgi:adenosylcobinamide-GDP ribazoletransferase